MVFQGVNPRAMIAITVAAAPNLLSLISGVSYLIEAGAFSGSGAFYTYVVNMEYASIIGAVIAFIVYLFIHLLELKPVKIGEVASVSVKPPAPSALRSCTVSTVVRRRRRSPREKK